MKKIIELDSDDNVVIENNKIIITKENDATEKKEGKETKIVSDHLLRILVELALEKLEKEKEKTK